MPLMYPAHGPSIIDREAVPSTLALLCQPYVFTQGSVLSARQFAGEARKRGLTLRHGELEQLHRRGVLVPFYRLHSRPIDAGHNRLPDKQRPGESWWIYRASSDGTLSDPGARRFRRWPRSPGKSSIFYSRFQLLALRSLPLVLSGMQTRRDGDRILYELDRLPRPQLQGYEEDRALAILLEVLAPRYQPRVRGVVRSPEDNLTNLVDDHDPRLEDAVLRLSSDRLLRQAEFLLSNARHFDPLGSWHRVTRIANPRRWDELRNDALIAQEYRVAAEMLLQFLEDQASQGRAAPIPPVSAEWREPRHDRLTVEPRERAETVMDFALSDRPAVYIALEGQTEVTIVANLLRLAGFDSQSAWISVIDLQGVGGDVNLLARAIAVPRLDPTGYRGARVLSPLTALLVVSDPEGRYATVESRSQALAGMKEHVLQSLPSQLRTSAMADDLDHLLHVQAWPQEFEFAHFSNTELARGIRSVVGSSCPDQKELRRRLQACRQARSSIRSVWKNWPQKPSKIALAQALWPGLEKRILNPRSHRSTPVANVVESAIRISYDIRRAREMAVRPDG